MKHFWKIFAVVTIILISGAIFYVVCPKYTVKNVSYDSTIFNMVPGPLEGIHTTQSKILIRVNSITGKVEKFISMTTAKKGGATETAERWDPVGSEK